VFEALGRNYNIPMQLRLDERKGGSKALKSQSTRHEDISVNFPGPASLLGNKKRCHRLPQEQWALVVVREHGKNDTE